MKPVFFLFCLYLVAIPATATAFNPFACPTGEDLDRGIVYLHPAKDLRKRGAYLYHPRHYRRLDGPLFGFATTHEALADTVSVSYAGLFTFRYWINGELRRPEEPLVDLSALLEFVPGTSHPFATVRRNPRTPDREWTTVGTYDVEAADDVEIDGCIYEAVELRRDLTVTDADGKEVSTKSSILYVPELMLPITGGLMPRGTSVARVRKRNVFDGKAYPFNAEPADVLD